MISLRLNLVLSKAQNCYAKNRLWKSAMREILIAVHGILYSILIAVHVIDGELDCVHEALNPMDVNAIAVLGLFRNDSCSQNITVL